MLHKKGCLIFGMLNSNYMKNELNKQILIGLFAYFSSTSLWGQQMIFNDDFSNSSLTTSKWDFAYQYTNEPPYRNSQVSVTSGTLVLTDGGISTTKMSFDEPYRINGSFGNFNGNAGSSFFVSLRSNGVLNNDFFRHPSGLQIWFAGNYIENVGQSRIYVYEMPSSGAATQVAEIVAPVLWNTFNAFDIFDDGQNVSVGLNGATYLNFSSAFSIGDRISINTGNTTDAQSQSVQSTVDFLTVTVPEPSALSLCAVGLGALAMMRRCRS
jgi:hypothetical protein